MKESKELIISLIKDNLKNTLLISGLDNWILMQKPTI
jgi:hypothetical protein